MPFHETIRFPGALALEQKGLATSEFQEESEGLKERGTWDVFLFYERGRKNEENCGRCPTITRRDKTCPRQNSRGLSLINREFTTELCNAVDSHTPDAIIEGVMNARNHSVPLAGIILPEQASARIPGAVVTIEKPTPVGHEGQ